MRDWRSFLSPKQPPYSSLLTLLKVEAVFGDGKLALVWILTGKPEEPRVRAALIAAYGEPITVGDDYEVFGDGSVQLRKDKPEVLFLSLELVAAWAEQNGGE
jgi:hypothetical protein